MIEKILNVADGKEYTAEDWDPIVKKLNNGGYVTLRETKLMHQLMWSWMLYKIEICGKDGFRSDRIFFKEHFIKEIGITSEIKYQCFLCNYNMNLRGYIYCKNCPAIWNKDFPDVSCCSGFAINRIPTAYEMWKNIVYSKVLLHGVEPSEEDLIVLKNAIKDIASIPWRDEYENKD